MLRLGLALFSVCLAVSMVLAQTDYCAKSLCGKETHIACKNNGFWASTCPKTPTPIIVNLDLNLKQLVLRLHNVRRSNLARGIVGNYAPARRMATMRWTPELAKLAELNVRQCQMKHDACHNTNRFRASGQNLAIITYSGARNSRTTEQLLSQAISMWWNEHINANMAVINNFPANWSGPRQIGHFAAMAQQPNYAVGCAPSLYTEKGIHTFLLACNYATTNWISRPVYVRGPTGAGCNTGTNFNFPGLCSVNEIYTL